MIFARPQIQCIPTPLLYVRRGWRVPFASETAKLSAALDALLYVPVTRIDSNEDATEDMEMEPVVRGMADGSIRSFGGTGIRAVCWGLYERAAVVSPIETPSQNVGLAAWTYEPATGPTLSKNATQTLGLDALLYEPALTATGEEHATQAVAMSAASLTPSGHIAAANTTKADVALDAFAYGPHA
ncbi:hypothetical protein [Geminisphaera colitermitum]|uniref:hypothetical protein n=1 Tax=Geminisphaera colitermitum TaxID=1148786 RepID=UPI000158C983|nr:hypothetical protein [Geminisphaera colitermitum]